MNNNNPNGANKTLQAQIIAQWITSLAISVVCCAVLFIVFAGYIVDLHDKTNLLTVKQEVLQERLNQQNAEIGMLKHTTVVQINGAPKPATTETSTPTTPAGEGASVPAAADNGDAKGVAPAKDDLMPVMNGEAPQEGVMTKPGKTAEPMPPATKK